MTEFETKVLALLELINMRLASIQSDINFVAQRERNKVEAVGRMVDDARRALSFPKLSS